MLLGESSNRRVTSFPAAIHARPRILTTTRKGPGAARTIKSMTRIYRVLEDGTTPLMSSVICKDEEKELQDLLERNPQLLAGEQISPDDPRRWLLIKREMDVPDPQSGAARWSVDFLFGDQDAVLTFVECKRSEDTRARREVIGQVLDYAANAHRLWTADLLRQYATRTAAAGGKPLADAIAQLGANATDVAGDYFDRAIENLKKNELRIVLFLESAPVELKSLVEFLNRDLTTVEVLIVAGAWDPRCRADSLGIHGFQKGESIRCYATKSVEREGILWGTEQSSGGRRRRRSCTQLVRQTAFNWMRRHMGKRTAGHVQHPAQRSRRSGDDECDHERQPDPQFRVIQGHRGAATAATEDCAARPAAAGVGAAGRL